MKRLILPLAPVLGALLKTVVSQVIAAGKERDAIAIATCTYRRIGVSIE